VLGLIESAKWNMRRISRLGKIASKNVKAQESSSSPPESSLQEVSSHTSNGNTCNQRHQDIFKIVSFRCENFVENLHGCSEQYDTIMW
jgi:7SK snRNA methylphosphate capping enzyme